ncbi:MAG: restriction endonuclease, partial [Acidimicrobiales bacterium]
MTAGQVLDANPIINDPFDEPRFYWHFGGLTPVKRSGRRTAGYLAPDPSGQLKIADEVIPLEVVNDLRDRVRAWRTDDYPGATILTKNLFRHWFDPERRHTNTRPFFAQQEAIETIVFLVEAPAERRIGIAIADSGEGYARWATKMATGAGKTLVMALTIAWSGLNRVANRRDPRFTDNIMVVCPN